MANENTSKGPSFTLEDILEAGSLNISNIAWRKIDPDLWFTPVSHDSTETHITTWANFNNIAQPFKRKLKLLLRNRGIYTGKNNGPIARQLSNLVRLNSPPEWPADGLKLTPPIELNKDVEKVKRVDSKDSLLKTSSFNLSGSHESSSKTHTSKFSKEYQQVKQLQDLTLPISQNPYNTLPPLPTENEDLNPFDITQISKLWDYGKMYTGEPYDILDDKLRIFFNICKFLKIRPSQFHAVLPRILKGRAESYYLHFIGPEASFASAYHKLKAHFDTEVNHNTYYTNWITITFTKIRQENSEKTLQEVLQILIDKLELCQRALGQNYAGEEVLRTAVIMACRGIPELKNALFKPAKCCEELFSDLRSSIEASLNDFPPRQFMNNNHNLIDQFYLDRRYNTNRQGSYNNVGKRNHDREDLRENNYRQERFSNNKKGQRMWKKKCLICGKEGCWSTKHPIDERRRARNQYLAHCQYTGDTSKDFATYLVGYEGHDMDTNEDDYLSDLEDENYSADIENYLMNQAYLHQLTGTDALKEQQNTPANQFLIEDRYSRTVFQVILPDTGAAKFSTAGLEKFLVLSRENSSIKLDKSTAGLASVCFGKGSTVTSIGTTLISTPLGETTFHILNTPTPFLLCLTDMDRMGVYFNNTTDELVKENIRITVIRK
ncbi:hypothetical protein HI914_02027 [Erysiphe necator]|nr:hypothetical protein HI914_02027 [Erysiphe necator]